MFKITIILILGLSQFTNALFFGLFNSKPTPKPDASVSETEDVATDNDAYAYENYIRSLISAYGSYPTVQYVPVYPVHPQSTGYVHPQHNYMYPTAAVRNVHHIASPVRFTYTHTQTPNVPNVKFQAPITVLPSKSHQQTSVNMQEVTQNMFKLIDAPTTSVSTDTLEREMPEPQMSTSLYDLPVSGTGTDFRTGGYVTKSMTVTSSDDKKRSGRRFGHAYNNGDGTKVSEEGQLVHTVNGQETVVKRGQYEYIDATGSPVLVKWIADDNGFRLVN